MRTPPTRSTYIRRLRNGQHEYGFIDIAKSADDPSRAIPIGAANDHSEAEARLTDIRTGTNLVLFPGPRRTVLQDGWRSVAGSGLPSPGSSPRGVLASCRIAVWRRLFLPGRSHLPG